MFGLKVCSLLPCILELNTICRNLLSVRPKWLIAEFWLYVSFISLLWIHSLFPINWMIKSPVRPYKTIILDTSNRLTVPSGCASVEIPFCLASPWLWLACVSPRAPTIPISTSKEYFVLLLASLSLCFRKESWDSSPTKSRNIYAVCWEYDLFWPFFICN